MGRGFREGIETPLRGMHLLSTYIPMEQYDTSVVVWEGGGRGKELKGWWGWREASTSFLCSINRASVCHSVRVLAIPCVAPARKNRHIRRMSFQYTQPSHRAATFSEITEPFNLITRGCDDTTGMLMLERNGRTARTKRIRSLSASSLEFDSFARIFKSKRKSYGVYSGVIHGRYTAETCEWLEHTLCVCAFFVLFFINKTIATHSFHGCQIVCVFLTTLVVAKRAVSFFFFFILFYFTETLWNYDRVARGFERFFFFFCILIDEWRMHILFIPSLFRFFSLWCEFCTLIVDSS